MCGQCASPMSACPLASASGWQTARKKGLWVRETKAPSSPIGGWIWGLCPSWESGSDPRLKTSGLYSVACRECSQTSAIVLLTVQAPLRSALFREDCLSHVE